MAKDPAFLFYTGDFATGTMFMSDDQVGKYIRLLIAQHQHGHLSEKQMIQICKEKDNEIWSKFKVDENGLFYNVRLDTEAKKRMAFSESRRNNRNKLNNDSLHIYFIKNPKTGLIKIGSSVDVERRLIELKRQYDADLELLFMSEKVSQIVEADLHKKYKESNITNEWFDLTKKDLEDIKGHLNIDMSDHMINHMEDKNEIINNIIQAYNSITGSKVKLTESRKSQINARLKEGYKLEDFEKVFTSKFKEWKNNPEMKKYITPETLMGNKFTKYFESASQMSVSKKETEIKPNGYPNPQTYYMECLEKKIKPVRWENGDILNDSEIEEQHKLHKVGEYQYA